MLCVWCVCRLAYAGCAASAATEGLRVNSAAKKARTAALRSAWARSMASRRIGFVVMLCMCLFLRRVRSSVLYPIWYALTKLTNETFHSFS